MFKLGRYSLLFGGFEILSVVSEIEIKIKK